MGNKIICDTTIEKISHHYKEILKLIDEDIYREGIIKTPKRAAKAIIDLTSGHKISLNELVNNAIFKSDNSEMVIAKGIEFHSLCEHHLLPFSGVAHVGYIPQGNVIGLSKIPRIIEMFSRRLQIQENLAFQIADTLNSIINAKGVAVIIQAKHSCVSMRGVQKQCSDMLASSMIGCFKEDPQTRNEFLELIKL